jgi:hypothetical protein
MGIKALNGDDNEIKMPSAKDSQIYVKSKISEAVMKEKRQRTGTDDVDYENIQPLTRTDDEIEDWI